MSGRWVRNVHSAEDWRLVLEPIVERYRNRDLRRYFRANAAIAKPEIYEFLEAEGYAYANRLPSNCGAASSLEKHPNSRLTTQSCGHQIHERVVSCARYEKLARNYLATLSIAATRIWIRYFESTT